jgi:Flp pilus assembly pilin Flp
MRKVLARLWKDDSGSVLAMEWMFVATILVLGAVAALPSVREAVYDAAAQVRSADR